MKELKIELKLNKELKLSTMNETNFKRFQEFCFKHGGKKADMVITLKEKNK